MRPFTAEPGHTQDFFAVRDFLVRINAREVRTPGFLWGRWEWAFALPYLDTSALDRIGVAERDGRIVALATYEQAPGEAWLLVDPAHRDLLPALVDHALDCLSVDGRLRVMVPDDDAELAGLVADRGLARAPDGEPNSALALDADLGYALPEGFRTLGLDETWDLELLHRLMHRGFGHPGEPDVSEAELAWRRRSTEAPGQRPDLQIVVEAPDGGYAAFCGTWLWPGGDYAMVEPVCTDPTWRLQGCGRAAVLEAVRRCRDLGARVAYVGSDQQFYARLGFRAALGGTWWATPGSPSE